MRYTVSRFAMANSVLVVLNEFRNFREPGVIVFFMHCFQLGLFYFLYKLEQVFGHQLHIAFPIRRLLCHRGIPKLSILTLKYT